MKFLFFCIIIITLFNFSACEKQVEGCMHPRSKNFNPEADKDKGCDYYELTLEIQHYANVLSNDTLVLGNWLTDADGQSFYLTKMSILASGLHLFRASNHEKVMSPENITLYDVNGTAHDVEDNFFISLPGTYTYPIAGWRELGTYDSLRFYIGLPSSIRQTNPSRVTEKYHPLSTTAVSYLYDSVSTSFQSCLMVAKQISTGNTIRIPSFDYIPISLPYSVTVVDGEDIPIRLRLNYLTLFNGISLTNDSPADINTKLTQNFQAAFSTY